MQTIDDRVAMHRNSWWIRVSAIALHALPHRRAVRLVQRLVCTCVIACTVTATIAGGAAAAESVTVCAAATLENALDATAALYRTKYKTAGAGAYRPSSALVKQIENGAPADIFISADPDWMDAAQRRGLIRRRRGSTC